MRSLHTAEPINSKKKKKRGMRTDIELTLRVAAERSRDDDNGRVRKRTEDRQEKRSDDSGVQDLHNNSVRFLHEIPTRRELSERGEWLCD